MPNEINRKIAYKRIAQPGSTPASAADIQSGNATGDGEVKVPVITEITFKDPVDRGQESTYTVNNAGKAWRDVHVAWVGDQGTTDATETPDLSQPTPDDCIAVERLDKWRVKDSVDRGQQTQPQFDNKTYDPNGPPFFTTHKKTHIVRYINSPDDGNFVDSELLDQINFKDSIDRGQQTHYTLQNPPNNTSITGIIIGSTTDDNGNPLPTVAIDPNVDLPDITEPQGSSNPVDQGTNDAPYRLDPFQNTVRIFGGAADFIMGGHNWGVQNIDVADVLIVNHVTGEVTTLNSQYMMANGNRLICIDAGKRPAIDNGGSDLNPGLGSGTFNANVNRYDKNQNIVFYESDSSFLCLDLGGNTYALEDTLVMKDKNGTLKASRNVGPLFTTEPNGFLKSPFYAATGSSLFFGCDRDVRRIDMLDENKDWSVSIRGAVAGLRVIGGNVIMCLGTMDDFGGIRTSNDGAIDIVVLNAVTGEEVRSFTANVPPYNGTNPPGFGLIGFAVDGAGNPCLLTKDFQQIPQPPPTPDADVVKTVYLSVFDGIDGSLKWRQSFSPPYAPRGPFAPYAGTPSAVIYPNIGEANQLPGAFIGAQGNSVAVQITWAISPAGVWNTNVESVFAYGADGNAVAEYDFPYGQGVLAQELTDSINAGNYIPVYGYYSAKYFPAGTLEPTMGSESCLFNGYNAKTGEQKWSLTGSVPDWNGSAGSSPGGIPNQPTPDPDGPMTGTLPLTVDVFGDGPNSWFHLPTPI